MSCPLRLEFAGAFYHLTRPPFGLPGAIDLSFPLDELIPDDLIETIVNLRAMQDSAKAAAKREMTRAARR